jgi:hypothetical protein
MDQSNINESLCQMERTFNPENPLQVIAPEEKQQDCLQTYLPQDSASTTSSMS